MIKFVERTHKYYDEENREFISATTILHQLCEPFDEQKMSALCAKKEGVTQEEIIRRWKEKRDNSCKVGTHYHSMMEHHILNKYCGTPYIGQVDEHFYKLFDQFDSIVSEFSSDEFMPEHLLYHRESRIAGIADLIINHGSDEFSIGDFKTNDSIIYSSKFGKRLLGSFSHLSDCNYVLYTLQMSLYAFMYERISGRKCRKLFLMWIDKNSNIMSYIPTMYMKDDIERLINERIDYLRM